MMHLCNQEKKKQHKKAPTKHHTHKNQSIIFDRSLEMNEYSKAPSKGILSFITGPSNIDDASCSLQFMPYNVHAERMRRNRSKRKNSKRSRNTESRDVEGAITRDRPYRPHNAEFTLLFFCEFNCTNTRRFTFILADFLRHARSDSDESGGIDTYQLVCIPNDDIRSQPNIENGTLMSHLQSETDFWHLGFDHKNRLPIIRILSVTKVPTVVVINNQTGKVVTSMGMEAIEYSEGDPAPVFQAWRNGKSAVPLTALLYQSCSIS